MKVKLIEGLHITATNKRAIAEIIANGWAVGSTKRITYRIEKLDGDFYKVEISQVETNDFGKKFVRKMTVKVEVKA